jgi:hypothetical protein
MQNPSTTLRDDKRCGDRKSHKRQKARREAGLLMLLAVAQTHAKHVENGTKCYASAALA